MKKIFSSLLIAMSFMAMASLCEARTNVVVAGGGWGGRAWGGGGVYVGYPGYYGYRPVPVAYPGVGPYVPYPAYQPYYGYYPYGPTPVYTGGPFIYNNGRTY